MLKFDMAKKCASEVSTRDILRFKAEFSRQPLDTWETRLVSVLRIFVKNPLQISCLLIFDML